MYCSSARGKAILGTQSLRTRYLGRSGKLGNRGIGTRLVVDHAFMTYRLAALYVFKCLANCVVLIKWGYFPCLPVVEVPSIGITYY